MKFLTPAEARAARKNLDVTAPMRVEEYGGLISDTHFPEIHYVECQLINKHQNVCRTKHGDGYIVRRKDGVEVFIGGDCFRGHLREAGGEIAKQFERDAAAMKRADDLANARRRFAEHKDKGELALRIAERWGRAKQLKEVQDRERRAIGPRVLDRLSKMAKSGKRAVPGEAKHIEMREDRDRKPYAIEVWKPISFGIVASPEALDPIPLDRMISELRAASTSLKTSTPIEHLEYKQLKNLLKTFDPVESISQRLDVVERGLASFATAANFRTVSWLARVDEDRERVIFHALSTTDQPRQPHHIRALIQQWLLEIQKENEGRECRPI